MKPKIRNFGLILVPAIAGLTLACGSKTVIMPAASAPAPSALVTPAAPSQVVVTTVPAMPAPPQDVTQSPSPGSDYVWVRGYYNWTGEHYVWVPGSWTEVPRPAAVWVPGQWQPTTGGYVWVAGHWR